MNNMYELDIPQGLRKVTKAGGFHGKRVTLVSSVGEYGTIIPSNMSDSYATDIRLEWLKEIKQPVNFRERFKFTRMQAVYELKNGGWIQLKDLLEEFYDYGAEDELLKHEPRQSFEEWFSHKYLYDGRDDEERSILKQELRNCHEWTERNRGYNEQT